MAGIRKWTNENGGMKQQKRKRQKQETEQEQMKMTLNTGYTITEVRLVQGNLP